MNPYALSIIISSLALGTITTMSSSHWILAWMGLEINTLAIIPLMTKNPHPRSIEAATKYFLTQAAASALILFSSIFNAWLLGEWAINNFMNPVSVIFLSIAISTKLGLAPFHFWMPDVLQGLTLQTGWILATWQKLAPMTVLLQLSHSVNLTLMMAMGFLSILIGGWGGINQNQIRKILAFSSIAHLGWMLMILKISPSLSILNFSLYIIMSSTLFYTFITVNSTNISQLATAWTKVPALTALSLLSLLSLSGLPPLTGFMPKWLIAQEMVKQDLTLISFTILMFTLLSLFFYLRLTYTISLTMAPNSSLSTSLWHLKKKNALTFFILLTLCLLPISPSLLCLI
uniref:NADH-ubiquinone oxidoreductase chain 2 n=1 Tax=Allobates aff. melanolaemusi AR-2020 TaxID=2772349 RepID=A0A7L9CUH1_9NEOB|nr:NADH dehydrogenase subunit 2 [Allobates aff. melanolaemusi AR-2020]